MGKTGDLCGIRNEIQFKWEIKNFLLLSHKIDTFYESPQFDFCGASWEIWIFPNGQAVHTSEGWIGIFLAPVSFDIPVTLNFSFSLKAADGQSECYKKATNVFNKKKHGLGFIKFIQRSELTERKSQLLPSDILTIICTLKDAGKNEAIGDEDFKKICVDAFAETNEDSGNEDSKKACVDAFAQTNEGTGVWELQHHLREIFLNGNISDVILKVDDQEFKCHRCILAARSPVFLGMMSNEMKEKNTGVVNIPDADPNTFSDFLNYLYTGSKENVTSLNVAKLYTAADKYQVDELRNVCLDYMLNNITVNNFCDFLTLSLKHVEKGLTDACSQFFIDNALDIILTSQWQIFISENPIAGNELHIKYIKQLQLNK